MTVPSFLMILAKLHKVQSGHTDLEERFYEEEPEEAVCVEPFTLQVKPLLLASLTYF